MKSKSITFTITLLLISALAFSQKNINASEIMNEIKNGKDISYSNTTIIGVLDFTFMQDALKNIPKRKKSWWGGNSSDNEIKKQIKNKISFINCTFTNNVLAYIPDEDSGYTFTASFDKEVVFKQCVFKEKAMFKYSKFDSSADFSDVKFEDDTTFKYAKFKKNSSFFNTLFKEPATFKYSKFNRKVSFENSVFEESTSFKYTKFNNGVSFKNVNFNEDLNLKYTQVTGEFDITGMKVAYDIDSKFTKINGKGFNKHVINSKN